MILSMKASGKMERNTGRVDYQTKKAMFMMEIIMP